jgi:alkanesulfonate monooxygenase
MHPYTVAKMISSLGLLHGRRVHLNLVAGGFKNDLCSLDDTVSHDARYERLVEYTTIVKRLLTGPGPVTFEGRFYRVTGLKLTPELPEELLPRMFVSGSSDAGLAAARALGATAVVYPKPSNEDPGATKLGIRCGVRVGVIARASDDEAWSVAHERFPDNRRGQITHHLAMQTSDSAWHQQLSSLNAEVASQRPRYWLGPFQNYHTFCPYLVGSYGTTGRELSRYIALGYRTFIVDIPPDEHELEHTRAAFRAADTEVAS